MKVQAEAKSVRISPRKVRIVADVIRNQSLSNALNSLVVIKKRGAGAIEQVLRSALANAKDRKLDEELLVIKSVDVVDGPAFKRYHPSTRGRVHPYKKRTSHIRIVLEEKEVKNAKKEKTVEKVEEKKEEKK